MKKLLFVVFVLTILLTACWSTPYPKSIKGDPYAPDYYYRPVYSYKSVAPKLNYTGNANIALVVHDQRPYITSGKTKPQYIGQLRPASTWGGGGWDIPMDVITEDERTLADTLTGIISDAVRKAGFHVTMATIEPKERFNAKNYNLLQNTRNDKIVVVVLNEWMTDEFYNLGFAYDISISVYSGESSNMAASYRLKGEDDLGGKGENREQRDALFCNAISKRLTELLNAESIKKAMQ